MTRIRLFLCIIAISVPSLAAAQQSMKFEEAGAMLSASCGKDIDDNCRGVNFDATRLKELNKLCGEVRQDPVKGLQCLLESTKKATPNCNKAISAAGYR